MRNLFIVSALLTALFTLCVALIHTQPRQDDALRAFVLPPEGCAAPCWQGLQPGVTDIFGIMSTLKSNVWVSGVHHENYSKFSDGFVRWNWSEQRPAFIRADDYNSLWYDESVAQNFYIETQLSLGEVWLVLGQPDWTLIRPVGEDYVKVYAGYAAQSLMVAANVPCWGSLPSMWRAKTGLSWQKELPVEGGPGVTALQAAVSCR